MRYFLSLLFFNVLRLSTMDVISNRYCADMRPQSYVTIEQLLGMWYGVEIINHKQDQERFGIQYVDSCPIIQISEDRSSTLSPLYKGNINYAHGKNYGSTYQQGSYDQGSQYGRSTHVETTNYPGRKYGSEEYPTRYADEIRRMQLLWTDNGVEVEYTLRYTANKPGFWMSSGPQNGSSLEPQYNHFAGTIQVIKAYGNHLVLTFCRQLPDQQLYTIILSRIPKLTRHEISQVHDLLTRRALEINNVKRVCSEGGATAVHINIFVITYVIGVNLLRIFKTRKTNFQFI